MKAREGKKTQKGKDSGLFACINLIWKKKTQLRSRNSCMAHKTVGFVNWTLTQNEPTSSGKCTIRKRPNSYSWVLHVSNGVWGDCSCLLCLLSNPYVGAQICQCLFLFHTSMPWSEIFIFCSPHSKSVHLALEHIVCCWVNEAEPLMWEKKKKEEEVR